MVSLIFLLKARAPQPHSDPAIEILIDRAPGGLLPGQPLDVMGRRFTPLLAEYRLDPQTAHDVFRFSPLKAGRPALRFTVIRDETTRTLKLLRGEADVLYDSIAISKTEWIRRQRDGLRVYSRSGLNLSYIGFSLRHPILRHREVRIAIAKALPVAEWAKHKLHGWVDLSTEFVSIPYSPDESRAELDRAGFPAGPDGVRFRLRYYTTPVREGAETALLVQEALRKVGIAVEIVTLDNLLYFQKMKKGDADLFFNRWFRFTEQEPIADYLMTGGNRNYFGYSNEKLDRRLKKNPVLPARDLAKLIESDFPFFPLYTWRHGLILGPRIQVPGDTQVEAELDESFRFLLLLDLK